MSSRRSIKTRLMIQFVMFILFFIIMNLGILFLLQQYNRNTFELFDRLNNTVSIAYHLGESHQHLNDYLNNYQDPLYEDLFLESLQDISVFLSELDAQINETARQYNEINYYYDFLEVQEMVLTYIEKSKILIARASSETKRSVLYDHLYELKAYKTEVFEKSSNLLFRQTLLIRDSVELTGKKLFYLTIIVISGTLIVAVFLLLLAFRMSDKITAPIQNLVLSAEKAAKGDFSPQKANIHADTEIQVLVDAFNNMMDNTDRLIKELEQKAELERLLRKAELESLNAQINPHFLFNTLNAINSLAMIEEADKTAEMITSLSDILRYYLQFGDKEISFKEELHLLKQYLKIQKTRFGKRLITSVNIQESTKALSIPPMLLQPILENGIKHGLEPKEGPGTISLNAVIDGDSLVIQIADDGIGIPEDIQIVCNSSDTIGKDHIGILNVKKRMEILYGPGCFKLQSKPGKTIFTFTFPLHFYEIEEVSDSGSF